MKVAEHDLLGVRVRLQRVRDCAFFEGWVSTFSSNRLGVLMQTDKAVSPGDEFHAEFDGRNLMAQAQVRFVTTDDSDIMAQVMTAGSQAFSLVQALELVYEFHVLSKLSYAPSAHPFRKKVDGVSAMLNWDGLEMAVAVLDVGEVGVGVLCPYEVSIGNQVEIVINSQGGFLHLRTMVARCAPAPSGQDGYILGLRIDTLNRVDAARWEKFIVQCSPI